MNKLMLPITAGILLSGNIAAYAAPSLTNPIYTPIGNDVKVTFGILDLARNGYMSLPLDFDLQLVEEGFFSDTLLGTTTIWLMQNQVTPLAGGGYRATNLMHTFTNASDAFTGFGDDYQLEIIRVYQSESVPEPTTIFGSVLAVGFGAFLKKKHSKIQKRNKDTGIGIAS